MFTYKILTFPSPELLRRAKEANPDIVRAGGMDKIIRRMIRTMHQEKGHGLAAPQVGLDCRLFVAMREGVAGFDDVLVAFNPTIAEPTAEIISREGCLSLPKQQFWVKRPEGFILQALDRYGNMFSQELHGILARACLHEIDHLDGILINTRGSKALGS